MRFGEVYTYENAEETRQFLGKNGAFSDNLRAITESPSECFGGTFRKIEKIEECPFYGADDYGFQFFRPVLEDDELMTNRQFAEWLSRGNGEYAIENGSLVATHFSYGKSTGDDPVDDYVIRRWRDTEWSKPTRAIYEEDCK